MGQHHHPDDSHDEDLGRYHDEDEDLEELGRPVYQGTGLSVRALTAEELQRFLDAHADQPAEPLGSGWATLDPPGDPRGIPQTPPAPSAAFAPSRPATGSKRANGRTSTSTSFSSSRARYVTWTPAPP